MQALFSEIFTRPLLNLLIFLYQTLPVQDLGLAIILLTILIRVILFPFVAKSIKAQKALAEIQPELKAVQEKYKNNKEEQAKQIMELYRARGVSPFSGCLPVLIQLPLLFALFWVFSAIVGPGAIEKLYSFVPHPDSINTITFGFLDLAKPSAALAILAGATQFLQAYLTPQAPTGATQGSTFAKSLQWQTTYFLPIFITVIAFRFASALPLYWTVLNIIGVIQQSGVIGRIFRRPRQ